jgi:LysM repeat protein
VQNIAPAPHFSRSTRRLTRIPHYLVPVALLAVIGATAWVIVAKPGRSESNGTSARTAQPRAHRLPAYWTVHPGDTLTEIARKTGLTVAELEALNPTVDPVGIFPGQRLKLRVHLPKPRPKPLGPRFWTVRSGQSFGSIAAKTRIDITELERLNPRLKPATLQPGDRVRLRR